MASSAIGDAVCPPTFQADATHDVFTQLRPAVGEPDYLKFADHPTRPSFHYRVGKNAELSPSEVSKQPTNVFGFPRPGVQSPTPAQATAAHYFVDVLEMCL